jgi:hypothetical protein
MAVGLFDVLAGLQLNNPGLMCPECSGAEWITAVIPAAPFKNWRG